MENSKQPAFGYQLAEDGSILQGTGLTKREYFAGLAMQGLLSNHELINSVEWSWIGEQSIRLSDELLKQLDKTT